MPSDDVKWGTLLETTLLTMLQSAGEGILVFDAGGVCRMAGRRTGDFFQTDPARLVGKVRTEVLVTLSAACEEPEAFLALVGASDLSDPPLILGEIEIRTPRRVVVWRSIPIRLEEDVVGRLVLLRDVTREVSAERARRHLIQRIELLTPVDALTGLANRRRFTEEHEREHGRAMRAWDSYAVMRLDIDDMTGINEQFGVPIGDLVLERVAELLRAGRRDYDVVARLVNDEFAILLPGADALAARAVADRIITTIAEAVLEDPEGPQLTLSIGVGVCVPPTGESASDVMGRAGLALQSARDRGVAQVQVDSLSSESKETTKDIKTSP
jgi:diguanylate cyclase (GGDEF)-like protein